MYKRILIFLLVLLIVCFNVYAHPGRTDGAGGHYNHSTGEYHYHHGEPEHQHPNGVCPYDENDSIQEKIENGIPLTQDEYREYKGLPPLEEEEEEDSSVFKKIMRVLVCCWWLIIPIVLEVFATIKDKKTKSKNNIDKLSQK